MRIELNRSRVNAMPAADRPRFRVYVPVPPDAWSADDWARVLALGGIDRAALSCATAMATGQQADLSIDQLSTEASSAVHMGEQCGQLQPESR